jgi:transcriptional regulator with XRE-family HTH domain
MSTPLDVEVRALLEQRRGDWQRVADKAKVSHSWISQFVRNKIPNPGYATLIKLKAHLTAPQSEAA